MRIILSILVMSIIFQGCESQSDFDLTQIKLSKEKINNILPNCIETNTHTLGASDNAYISSKADALLKFNSTSLVGRQNPDSDRGINGVSLYFNKKDSIVYKYQVTIFSDKQAKDLLNALKTKLGDPNYTKYMRFGDKEKDDFSSLLWEDKSNNLLYLFDYSLEETIKAKLEVKNNSENIEELNLYGSFSYWEDYLLTRKRKENKDYSYQDFLAEKLENDAEDIRNKLSK